MLTLDQQTASSRLIFELCIGVDPHLANFWPAVDLSVDWVSIRMLVYYQGYDSEHSTEDAFSTPLVNMTWFHNNRIVKVLGCGQNHHLLLDLSQLFCWAINLNLKRERAMAKSTTSTNNNDKCCCSSNDFVWTKTKQQNRYVLQQGKHAKLPVSLVSKGIERSNIFIVFKVTHFSAFK